jgi:hypothetical protein
MYVQTHTHLYDEVIGMIFLNPYLFHYFLWEYRVSFMPTFTGTQLAHKSRSSCILF